MSNDSMTARQFLEKNHADWLKDKTDDEIQAKIAEMTEKAKAVVARMPAGSLGNQTKH